MNNPSQVTLEFLLRMFFAAIDQCAMLNELHRLGLPTDQKGFSDKNFYSFYRTK